MTKEQEVLLECEEKLFYKGDSFLKELIVGTICQECDFSEQQLEFYTWLLWSLGLTNS